MSILGAMFAGVSGLNSNSQAMANIANNISNVNTVGYKASRAAFSTLVTQSIGATGFATGGVQVKAQNLNGVQGLLQQTQSATDIAISGNGFFVVNTLPDPNETQGQFMFTRAGQFTPDENGDLVNTAGHYLQGWPIDANGNIPTNRTSLAVLETVNVRGLNGSAQATSNVELRANLQSTQTVNPNIGSYVAGDIAADNFTPDFETSVQVFDSLGGTRNLTFGFVKSATANEWLAEVYVEPATDVDGATHPNGLIATGTIAFNTDGSLDLGNTSAALQNLNITWDSSIGSAPSTIAVDLGTDGSTDRLTQFNGISQIISSDVDGAVFGALFGIQVGEDGIVTALFDNGTQQDVFKIPLATFPNANGLDSRSGNAFLQTDESGDFSLNEAAVGGAGTVASSAVETSTVDLAAEFTDMIQTQRAFSANGRIITTADEMLDELVRLKR